MIYTVEFQKRGLPHAHILLWFDPAYKFTTPDKIDVVISIEIPDENEDPILYDVVKSFMIHGPCDVVRLSSSCMVNNKCQINKGNDRVTASTKASTKAMTE